MSNIWIMVTTAPLEPSIPLRRKGSFPGISLLYTLTEDMWGELALAPTKPWIPSPAHTLLHT